MQKVMLIGNLGRDPKVKYSQQGTAIAQFSVATTERWMDKSGEPQEHTEWFAAKTFGRRAESSARACTRVPAFISKGGSARSPGTTNRRGPSTTEISFMSTGSSSWTPGAAGTDIESQPKAALTKQL